MNDDPTEKAISAVTTLINEVKTMRQRALNAEARAERAEKIVADFRILLGAEAPKTIASPKSFVAPATTAAKTRQPAAAKASPLASFQHRPMMGLPPRSIKRSKAATPRRPSPAWARSTIKADLLNAVRANPGKNWDELAIAIGRKISPFFHKAKNELIAETACTVTRGKVFAA